MSSTDSGSVSELSVASLEKKVPLDDSSIGSSVSDLPLTKEVEERATPWPSIWLSVLMQLNIGIQLSIYYMSMPIWLMDLDKSANLDFVGWVVAAASFGCSVMNPLFGYWNQRTLSMTSPVVVGMAFMAAGQLLYGLLPIFTSHVKWIMLVARLITGCGAGSLSVLRAYVATASTPGDRMKAISMGTAGFVIGLACGPAIQAAFTVVGKEGIHIGRVVLDMYTLPAFTMVAFALVSLVIMKLFFVATYAGIISDEEKDADKYNVVPKYDKAPALVCIYLWVISCSVATNIEVISTPVSMVFYDWNDSKDIFINGIMSSAACIVSVFFYILIGYTRIGQMYVFRVNVELFSEKRKQIIFGLLCFLAYYIANYPWPFYSGPLNYIRKDANGTEDTSLHGGCYERYHWCKDAVRVPLPLYVFCYIFLYGIAFPFIGTPSGTLFSQILGPRKQGMMQGFMALGGSFAQFVTPLIATTFFQHFGYLPVVITMIVELGIGAILIAVFYRRLVPLKMVPDAGQSSKYKNGTLYRF